MQSSRWLSSTRIFMLVGIALVILAFATFPTKVIIYSQPADADGYNIGWLFSPIIGVWGLAVVALGLVQSAMPKRKAENYLLFVSAVICVGLAYASYLAVLFGSGIFASVGRGEPLFLVYFAMVLAPSIVVLGSTAKYLKSKEKSSFVASGKVRTAALTALVAVPLTYTFVLLSLLNVI